MRRETRSLRVMNKRPEPRRGGVSVPPIEEVAAITQRLAVLLSAGVSPVSAWGYLLPAQRLQAAGEVRRPIATSTIGAGNARPLTTALLSAADRAANRGDSVADAIIAQVRAGPAPARRRQTGSASPADQAWRGLAAAWQVATQAGAPLAGSLRELAASLRDLAQVQRDLDVALAAPQATARLIMVLPVIGIVFGSLMGFDSLRTLFATFPGWVCLGAGAVLMLVAQRWNGVLVRRAAPTDVTPGLKLELTAIAMSGGGSVDRSLTLVQAAAERCGIAIEADSESVHRVLQLSMRAGVPAAELLRSEAEQLRRDARSAGQRRAAALSVTLMLPLGLCVLPAFMLVGVVPLLMSVLSSTFIGF